MRRLLGVVAAISLVSTQPGIAARQCTSLKDQSTFELQALRSELMVLATGCHDDDSYNAFIHRYQGDLQANEREVDAYFSHRYGRGAQTEHDRYVTELANAMSRQGSDLGGDFCPRNGLIFHEVLSLPATADLADFAAGKDLVPSSVDTCAPLATAEAKTRRVEAKAVSKKK